MIAKMTAKSKRIEIYVLMVNFDFICCMCSDTLAANVSSSKNPSEFLFKLNFEVNIAYLPNNKSLF